MLTLGWLAILAMMLLLISRERFLLSPMSVFLLYSMLALPAAYLIASGLELPSVFYLTPSQIPVAAVGSALLATLLAMLGLVVGRYWMPPVRLPHQRSLVLGSRLTIAVPLGAAIATASAMQLVGDLGGLSRMLSELGAVRSGELVGRGPQVYAVTMLLPTLFQWWLVYELRSGHRNRRYLALTLCLISSLLGGLLGFRGPIAALLIQTATIWYLFTGRPTKRSMVVAMAVVIPVATLSSILRLTFNEVAFEKLGDADPRLVIGYLSDTALTRVRGVEAFTVLHTKMESLPYGMFLANVRESVLALVPSAIVDKPISVTEDIATQVFSDYLFDAGIIKDIYGGVSYTYISEGYWNLGYLGVLMQGFVFGWLFNCCSRLELSRRPTDLEVLFYKACAGFALLLVEAPQLGVNAIILNVFVNLLIVTALSMRLLPAPTSAAGPPLSR